MQKILESEQRVFTILQVKSHFLCTFWGQKSRLARLAIFLHGWRLTLRVKFCGWLRRLLLINFHFILNHFWSNRWQCNEESDIKTISTYSSGSPSLICADTWQGTCLVIFWASEFLDFSIHSSTPVQMVCLSLATAGCCCCMPGICICPGGCCPAIGGWPGAMAAPGGWPCTAACPPCIWGGCCWLGCGCCCCGAICTGGCC
jgi:hypothetical protein